MVYRFLIGYLIYSCILAPILVFDQCNNLPLDTLTSIPWYWCLEQPNIIRRLIGKTDAKLKVKNFNFS